MKPEEALVVTLNGKGQIYCQKKESKWWQDINN
jgi:hypothetical protein